MKKAVNIELGPRYWNREPVESDRWDYGDSDCDVDITVVESDHSNYDGITTDLEFPFYAVYAKYYTGSTFGQEAAGQVFGAYAAKEEAEKAVEELKSDTSYSVPWNGYFESLGYIEIERVDGFSAHRKRYYV